MEKKNHKYYIEVDGKRFPITKKEYDKRIGQKLKGIKVIRETVRD